MVGVINEEAWLKGTVVETKLEKVCTDSIKPCMRSLFEPIEGTTEFANMRWVV